MLLGVPEILSPELLKVLCEMGHSDRLVIADGNFPVESMGKNAVIVRCDGHGVPEILDAILTMIPLDTYVAVSYTHLDVYKRQPYTFKMPEHIPVFLFFFHRRFSRAYSVGVFPVIFLKQIPK